jgi:hypothetical protein
VEDSGLAAALWHMDGRVEVVYIVPAAERAAFLAEMELRQHLKSKTMLPALSLDNMQGLGVKRVLMQTGDLLATLPGMMLHWVINTGLGAD